MDPLFLSLLALAVGNSVIRLSIWVNKRWLTQQPEAGCGRGVLSSDLRRSSEDGLRSSSAAELGSEHDSSSSVPYECHSSLRKYQREVVGNDLNTLGDSSTSSPATPQSSTYMGERYINQIISAVTGYVDFSDFHRSTVDASTTGMEMSHSA
jgi:hypothetical protein